MDSQEITCLIFLDLPAAFDTVNHEILIKHLQNKFGISTALQWIESYLKNRSQKVAIDDLGTDLGVTSKAIPLTSGVPHSSNLGPILFTLYQAPLGSICKKHGVTYHLYAGAQQIYPSFKPMKKGSWEECISRIETCIREISEWMTNNLVKLKEEKTIYTF